MKQIENGLNPFNLDEDPLLLHRMVRSFWLDMVEKETNGPFNIATSKLRVDWSFPPVLTKRDFVQRYAQGEFGNASPTWSTEGEFSEFAFTPFGSVVYGTFHLRNRVKGGESYYDLTPLELAMCWRHHVADKSQWYASAMAPHECNVLQGEVIVDEHGWRLFYSTEKGKDANMRKVLGLRDCDCCIQRAKTMFFRDPGPCGICGSPYRKIGKVRGGKHAEGLTAKLLLQRSLCANSWEWLNELLRRYPGHVVEFSTFSRKWGTLPNFNTVFWEIRKY